MAQQPPAPPPPPPPGPPPPPPPPGQPPGAPMYGGAPAYGTRPGGLTGAAVLLFIVGGLRVIFSLIGLVFIIGAAGNELAGIPGAGAAIGVAVVIILLVVAAGVLQIIGGIHTLRLRRLGRALGLAGTITGLALGVIGLLGSLSGGAAGASVIFTLLFLIADIVIIVLLAQNGRYLTNP